MNVKTIAIGIVIGQWAFVLSAVAVYLAYLFIRGLAISISETPPEVFVICGAVIASLVAIAVYLSRRDLALKQS